MTTDVCFSCHGPGPHGCQGGGCTCGCIPDIVPSVNVGKHTFTIELDGPLYGIEVYCPVPDGELAPCSAWACDCIGAGDAGEGCWTLGRPDHPRKAGVCTVKQWVEDGDSRPTGLYIYLTGDVEIDEDGAVNLLTIDDVGAHLGEPS